MRKKLATFLIFSSLFFVTGQVNALTIGNSQLGSQGRLNIQAGQSEKITLANDINKKTYVKIETVVPADSKVDYNATNPAPFVRIFPKMIELEPGQSKKIKVKCTGKGKARLYFTIDSNDFRNINGFKINMILRQGYPLECK